MANEWTLSNTPVGTLEMPKVQVSFGPIGTSEDTNVRFDDDPRPGVVFTDYHLRCRYEKDQHVYQLPITSPLGFGGAMAAFVQLAAPTLMLIVEWTAAKLNQQPEVPSADNGTNWILLRETIQPAAIVVGPDGQTPLYRISGTYVYGCKNPKALTMQDVTFPLPPFIDPAGLDRTMPLFKLKTGLSRDENAQSWGGGRLAI